MNVPEGAVAARRGVRPFSRPAKLVCPGTRPRAPPLTRLCLRAPAGVPTFKLVLVGDGGTGASPRRGATARAKLS
jgi:hypothetical protein